jgi:microcystin-dependent protein
MTNPYLGEITVFAGNFAISGYAFCNGQLLSISQYSALFSLLGTNFGGNGTSNFGLPNMQNNAPMHWGTGPGLSTYVIGETTGSPTVTLQASELPQHNHTITAAEAAVVAQRTGVPSASVWLGDSASGEAYSTSSTPVAPLSPLGISLSGSGGSHPNVQPLLALNFIIALVGVYPTRN